MIIPNNRFPPLPSRHLALNLIVSLVNIHFPFNSTSPSSLFLPRSISLRQQQSNNSAHFALFSFHMTSERTSSASFSAIGDRILAAPQTFARIITIPDADVAMVQFDNILAVNGSMISNGSLNDNTNYVSMNHFEWDAVHEYWKPKFSVGDK